MKPFCLLFTLIILSYNAHAQLRINNPNGGDAKTFIIEEQPPQFPGGIKAFENYLSKNIKYPPIACLIGINGKVTVTFTIDKNGRVSEAIPQNCIGAGCEAEAARVIKMSPAWHPGTLGGKRVLFQFSVPVSFLTEKKLVKLSQLRDSGFGFIFNIKGKLYTINEAERIIGKSFSPDKIQIAEPFYNYNKIQKFVMPDKKETYLLIFK